ncbi:MAG: hypothetical protein AABZ06_13330 [Bdellovibrionota bacterium]
MKLLLGMMALTVGLTGLSVAMGSVPAAGNFSEINARKQSMIDFDKDIATLANLEKRYYEQLPAARHPRLQPVIKRITGKQYKHSSR